MATPRKSTVHGRLLGVQISTLFASAPRTGGRGRRHRRWDRGRLPSLAVRWLIRRVGVCKSRIAQTHAANCSSTSLGRLGRDAAGAEHNASGRFGEDTAPNLWNAFATFFLRRVCFRTLPLGALGRVLPTPFPTTGRVEPREVEQGVSGQSLSTKRSGGAGSSDIDVLALFLECVRAVQRKMDSETERRGAKRGCPCLCVRQDPLRVLGIQQRCFRHRVDGKVTTTRHVGPAVRAKIYGHWTFRDRRFPRQSWFRD